jgi:hypothetical protein
MDDRFLRIGLNLIPDVESIDCIDIWSKISIRMHVSRDFHVNFSIKPVLYQQTHYFMIQMPFF